MRCVCCNEVLDDYEATRRNVRNNEYIDMCSSCYSTINADLKTIDRADLRQDSDIVGIDFAIHRSNTM